LLSAAALGLAAAVGAHWAPRPEAPALESHPLEPWGLPVSENPDFARLTAAIAQRNIWGTVAAAKDGQGAKSQAPPPRFAGIAVRGGERYVFVQQGTEPPTGLAVGDVLPGRGKIVRIDADRIVVQEGGKDVLLELFQR
jgi:hypothetical protein